MYKNVFKRWIDIISSFISIIILIPIFIIVYILVKINLGSPVLFVQERPGKHCKIFKLYKFRTMKNLKDSNGNLLSDEERLTRFGKWLRASSLDELPELWNVLKGDMSLVGPRPLLIEYLELYSKRQLTRQNVRPGLTGLAQVSGRNMITWEKRLELDVNYVNNITFFEDMKILLKTIKKVIKQEGICSEECITMKPFEGNK